MIRSLLREGWHLVRFGADCARVLGGELREYAAKKVTAIVMAPPDPEPSYRRYVRSAFVRDARGRMRVVPASEARRYEKPELRELTPEQVKTLQKRSAQMREKLRELTPQPASEPPLVGSIAWRRQQRATGNRA